MDIEKLYNILNNLHPDQGIDFSTHETLIDDGVLDSFDIVTLVGEISDVFDLRVPPEEITPENFNSAKKLFAMLERVSEE